MYQPINSINLVLLITFFSQNRLNRLELRVQLYYKQIIPTFLTQNQQTVFCKKQRKVHYFKKFYKVHTSGRKRFLTQSVQENIENVQLTQESGEVNTSSVHDQRRQLLYSLVSRFKDTRLRPEIHIKSNEIVQSLDLQATLTTGSIVVYNKDQISNQFQCVLKMFK